MSTEAATFDDRRFEERVAETTAELAVVLEKPAEGAENMADIVAVGALWWTLLYMHTQVEPAQAERMDDLARRIGARNAAMARRVEPVKLGVV